MSPSHVVVVHCKAGKGRTGICVAALLLHLGEARTWTAALARFALARTRNGAGVTIASQRRWVQYYDALRHLPDVPAPAAIRLGHVALKNLPARAAPRITILVTRRLGRDADFAESVVVEASMPPVASPSWPHSAVASVLCGYVGRGVVGSAPALCAPHGRSVATVAAGVAATPHGRVHHGRGWRMMQTGASSVALIFDVRRGSLNARALARSCRVQRRSLASPVRRCDAKLSSSRTPLATGPVSWTARLPPSRPVCPHPCASSTTSARASWARDM